MKVLPSIAFGEFTGSAGDVTARSIGGRTILNHKAYQNKVKSSAQCSSRNTLSKVSRAYKQLTDSQMKAWGALAEHLKGISTFGKAAEMTAHNAFVRINSNRQLVGMPLFTDAPEYTNDVPEPDFEDYWVTPEAIVFIGLEQPKPSYNLVIRMGPAQSMGVSSGWNNLVIVTPDMIPDWSEVDVFKIYVERFGVAPELGKKYFISMYWLDADTGFTGESMNYKAICDELSQIKHLPYVKPVKLKTEDFVPSAEFEVAELDLSCGGGFGAVRLEGQGESGVASIKANLAEELEDMESATTYLLARCPNDENFHCQLGEAGIRYDWSSKYIFFYHRMGRGVKPYEVLGVGVFY